MFCIQCGKANLDGAKFCFACGKDLTQSAPPQPASGVSAFEAAPQPGVSVGEAGATQLPAGPADAVEELAPGTVVEGRYRVERLLGRGGMGGVWKAVNERLNEPCALKFIKPQLCANASIRQRFLQEAAICRRLIHENIVRVHDVSEWRGQIYLAMEFLDGPTLGEWLKRRADRNEPVDWKTARELLRRLMGGIGHAHSRGVIHRDLKPGNILLAKQAGGKVRLVVTDFGLAKSLEAPGHTVLGASLGTAYYMAPEQLKEAAKADERADVYAAGAIAYEMLTGEPPMGRAAALSQLRPDLPEGIDPWIFQALDRQPAKRFASMSAMAEAMGRIGVDRPSPCPLPGGEGMEKERPSPRSLLRGEGEKAKEGSYTETASGLNLEMIWVPGGTFQMGSPDSEPGRQNDEGPVHTVTLDGFWLGKTEVTQAQYEKIMGRNPSQFKGPDNLVEQVTWGDAAEFCQKLSAASGKTYTLPTEAQWEYSCRAGSQGPFCFGDDEVQLGGYAWYNGNSGNQTHPVGQKQPNSSGLYDMHGNVWEWCRDWYGPYGSEAQTNPAGSGSGQYRVLRGGSWYCNPSYCRAAYRYWLDPASTSINFGFRVCRGSAGP